MGLLALNSETRRRIWKSTKSSYKFDLTTKIKCNYAYHFYTLFKMSPLVAYFLGIITILIILIPFWYLARVNQKISTTYKNIFCNSLSGGNATESKNIQ